MDYTGACVAGGEPLASGGIILTVQRFRKNVLGHDGIHTVHMPFDTLLSFSLVHYVLTFVMS